LTRRQPLGDGDSGHPGVFRFADLTLDKGQRRVWRGEAEIELPRLSFDFLTALVEAAPNSLSTDELMNRVWAGTVVSPATVAKRAELVRDALGDDSDEARYIALVRGHGYRLIPAVTTGTIEPGRSRLPGFALAVAAILMAAVVLGALQYLSDDAAPDKSIAVLPFASMTTDPDGEIFADGLTDELSHRLARLGDLKVTGRTSSFYFKGRNDDLRTIGKTLNVTWVLEGSVRYSGDQLRITAHLVNAKDGFRLWSESYDREMRDILEIQKDIAQEVATNLKVVMIDGGVLENPAEKTIDPEAYALYLRAVSLSPYGKVRDLGEAQRLVERVTEMAPGFAPAWNRLAAIHGRRLIFRDPGYEYGPDESRRIAMHAVDRALAIDPYDGDAYANLAGAAWVFEQDIRKAAPLIEKALELEPWNLDFVSFAADFAKHIGRLEEALELEEVLVRRDPLCDTCRGNLASSYVYAGRYDDAERQYRTLQTMHGGHFFEVGVVLLLKRQPQRALEEFGRLEDPTPTRQLGEAMALHDLGRTAEAWQLLGRVEAQWGDTIPILMAEAYAYTGDKDKAFAWLERLLPDGIVVLQTSYLHPVFDSLRDDPRWPALLERIGRSPEQLQDIPFSLDTPRSRLGL
jgi:TolB-like protein/DNA-binding winged helix-turn-helix (wHTH) protein/tetratricopeptide (TPR) repeat protein